MIKTNWQALKQNTQDKSELLKNLINEADALVIGIGAGMSASDGFTYIGDRFEKNFPDFIKKYNLLDMLQASLYEFESSSEYWAFQSRFIVLNYLEQPQGKGYIALKEILEKKDYHIITTNADNAFWVTNYDKEKIFHIQGEYGLLQCSKHCHQKTYKNFPLIYEMVEKQKEMKVPYEILPTCPKCNAFMEVNKRNAEKGMVEDKDFFEQKKRYDDFLEKHKKGKVLYIEIGVGYTTPQYIKYPFQKKVEENQDALFIILNEKNYRIKDTIKERTVTFNENIKDLLIKTNEKIKTCS